LLLLELLATRVATLFEFCTAEATKLLAE